MFILEELAKWFAVNSEAIYDTRPYRVAGEGDTRVVIDGFREEKTEWNPSDIRFTRKDDAIYAFLMAAPESRTAIIKSLADENIAKVELLGAGEIPWSKNFGVLTAKLPENLPTEYVNCLKITLA